MNNELTTALYEFNADSTQLALAPKKVDQAAVCRMQDLMLAETENIIEPTYEHYFAPGVYARVMHVPAGATVVGKAHKTDHICILLKGTLTITNEDDTLSYIQAPAVAVIPGGKKKLAYAHTDMSFVNIHPTEKTNIDDIEQDVIIPEDEYREMLALQTEKDVACLGQ